MLITTPPPLPDLVGYLDPAPPQYVKKYSNGTIYMNPTFVIGKIGGAGVTDEIVTQVTFVGESENYTITDDIAAGANYTIFTDITIDPSYSGTEVVEVKETGSVTLIITAGADISPGTKQVSIDINPDRTIEEIRYDNNFIEAQTTVTHNTTVAESGITFDPNLDDSTFTNETQSVISARYVGVTGVRMFLDGTDVTAKTTSPSNGVITLNYTLYGPLADGEQNVVVNWTSTIDPSEVSASETFTKDTVPPVVVVTGISDSDGDGYPEANEDLNSIPKTLLFLDIDFE